MKNLPFSKKWRSDTPQYISVILYLECQESWERAKRGVEKGWPVLLLPDDMEISNALLPVVGREVNIIDLVGKDSALVKRLGAALIRAGATMALYLGPNDQTIFFEPEVKSWVA